MRRFWLLPMVMLSSVLLLEKLVCAMPEGARYPLNFQHSADNNYAVRRYINGANLAFTTDGVNLDDVDYTTEMGAVKNKTGDKTYYSIPGGIYVLAGPKAFVQIAPHVVVSPMPFIPEDWEENFDGVDAFTVVPQTDSDSGILGFEVPQGEILIAADGRIDASGRGYGGGGGGAGGFNAVNLIPSCGLLSHLPSGALGGSLHFNGEEGEFAANCIPPQGGKGGGFGGFEGGGSDSVYSDRLFGGRGGGPFGGLGGEVVGANIACMDQKNGGDGQPGGYLAEIVNGETKEEADASDNIYLGSGGGGGSGGFGSQNCACTPAQNAGGGGKGGLVGPPPRTDGECYFGGSGSGGAAGGGAISLVAHKITINGQVLTQGAGDANLGAGYGAGGGILIRAIHLEINTATGIISSKGGCRNQGFNVDEGTTANSGTIKVRYVHGDFDRGSFYPSQTFEPLSLIRLLQPAYPPIRNNGPLIPGLKTPSPIVTLTGVTSIIFDTGSCTLNGNDFCINYFQFEQYTAHSRTVYRLKSRLLITDAGASVVIKSHVVLSAPVLNWFSFLIPVPTTISGLNTSPSDGNDGIVQIEVPNGSISLETNAFIDVTGLGYGGGEGGNGMFASPETCDSEYPPHRVVGLGSDHFVNGSDYSQSHSFTECHDSRSPGGAFMGYPGAHGSYPRINGFSRFGGNGGGPFGGFGGFSKPSFQAIGEIIVLCSDSLLDASESTSGGYLDESSTGDDDIEFENVYFGSGGGGGYGGIIVKDIDTCCLSKSGAGGFEGAESLEEPKVCSSGFPGTGGASGGGVVVLKANVMLLKGKIIANGAGNAAVASGIGAGGGILLQGNTSFVCDECSISTVGGAFESVIHDGSEFTGTGSLINGGVVKVIVPFSTETNEWNVAAGQFLVKKLPEGTTAEVTTSEEETSTESTSAEDATTEEITTTESTSADVSTTEEITTTAEISTTGTTHQSNGDSDTVSLSASSSLNLNDANNSGSSLPIAAVAGGAGGGLLLLLLLLFLLTRKRKSKKNARNRNIESENAENMELYASALAHPIATLPSSGVNQNGSPLYESTYASPVQKNNLPKPDSDYADLQEVSADGTYSSPSDAYMESGGKAAVSENGKNPSDVYAKVNKPAKAKSPEDLYAKVNKTPKPSDNEQPSSSVYEEFY